MAPASIAPDTRRWAMLLLAAGAAERVVFLLTTARHDVVGGEAANVAAAFAGTGSIADVFGKGSGLTAHLNPVVPAIAGAVYRIFGLRTPGAEAVLSLLSIACVLAAAGLFHRAVLWAGASPRGALAALAVFCLVPLNNYLEIVDFRAWEGGLATLLGAACLLLTVRADARGEVSWRIVGALALLAALAFFINPPLGIAAYANALLLLVRRVPATRWPAAAGVAAVMLAAVLTPWTIRNYEAFGRVIPLRGNFGLELALANHPAAVSGDDEIGVFRARLAQIHPQMSWDAFRAMQRTGGEIAYADRLGAEAKRWIAAHPRDFVRLSLRHLGQFYFPPAWQWSIYGGVSTGQRIKLMLSWAIALAGLAGAAAALFVWRGRLIYLATIALVPVLPYMIVQPIPRYRYLVYLPLLALGAEFGARLFMRLGAGRLGRTG